MAQPRGTAPRPPALTGGVEQAGAVAVELDALLAVLRGVCQRRYLGPGRVPVLHSPQVGLVHAGARHPRGVVAVVPDDGPCSVLYGSRGAVRTGHPPGAPPLPPSCPVPSAQAGCGPQGHWVEGPPRPPTAPTSDVAVHREGLERPAAVRVDGVVPRGFPADPVSVARLLVKGWTRETGLGSA